MGDVVLLVVADAYKSESLIVSLVTPMKHSLSVFAVPIKRYAIVWNTEFPYNEND